MDDRVIDADAEAKALREERERGLKAIAWMVVQTLCCVLAFQAQYYVMAVISGVIIGFELVHALWWLNLVLKRAIERQFEP